MAKPGSATRSPSASRRRTVTVPQTAVDAESASKQEQTTKRRGELAELAFTLKATTLGFAVSKPYGDSERYDFIVDARGMPSADSIPVQVYRAAAAPQLNQAATPVAPPAHLHRIQVKCSTQLLNGLYRLNAYRRLNGGAVPYRASEIDFIAAYIIPEDTWYILPLAATRNRTSLLFRRKRDRKPGLYDAYKEAWHLLRE